MATIQLSIPNDKVARFLEATGYHATIANEQGEAIPNPITPSTYSKNWILDVIKQEILRYEAGVAAATASNAAFKQDLSDIL